MVSVLFLLTRHQRMNRVEPCEKMVSVLFLLTRHQRMNRVEPWEDNRD
jgi:hypothetical protein